MLLLLFVLLFATGRGNITPYVTVRYRHARTKDYSSQIIITIVKTLRAQEENKQICCRMPFSPSLFLPPPLALSPKTHAPPPYRQARTFTRTQHEHVKQIAPYSDSTSSLLQQHWYISGTTQKMQKTNPVQPLNLTQLNPRRGTVDGQRESRPGDGAGGGYQSPPRCTLLAVYVTISAMQGVFVAPLSKGKQ